MSDETAIKIGWIGLGLMGQSHVVNLLKNGYRDLKVYNRSREKCIEAVSLGAEEGTSAKEVVETCDVTFVMLSSPSVAKTVYLAPDGILAGLKTNDRLSSPPKGIIECASLDADVMRELADLVHNEGGQFCASPVAGHSGMARNATCQLICAGDELLFHRMSRVLDSFSKNKVWVGNDPGAAANMKLILNGLLANITGSVAEALALANTAQLNVDALENIIGGHAMNSPLIQLCMGHMRSANYPSLFALEHMEKDSRLSCELGSSLGLPCHISNATRKTYVDAIRLHGLANENWTSVYESVAAKGSNAVKMAYRNHVTAFYEQSVAKIMQDYSEQSVLLVYNMRSGQETIFAGLGEIQKCFESTFSSMSDLSEFATIVSEVTNNPCGRGFLVWKNSTTGIDMATDSFIFDGSGKIRLQYFVGWFASVREIGTSTSVFTQGFARKAWNSYSSNFLNRNIEDLISNYRYFSILSVYNMATNVAETFQGTEAISKFFSAQFAKLIIMSDLEYLCVKLTEDPPAIFFVWKCLSSGVSSATETITLDQNGLIRSHHVVIEHVGSDEN